MLKRILLLLTMLVLQSKASAADLLTVYQKALCSDPIFSQTMAKVLVTKDNVPISIAAILPNISVFTNPMVSSYTFSGTEYKIGTIGDIAVYNPRNLTQRTYTLNLGIAQPIFNFGLFSEIAIQLENAKAASATLNAALQNLMVRVARAYFAILRDEENLEYTLATKRYHDFQLSQVKHKFEVGLRTITDVYTAQASYDSAIADHVIAKRNLANSRENLRAITGVYYHHLSYLKNNFPLISPKPNNIDQWVNIAIKQNWSIKAAQYTTEAAKRNIKQQMAGHLPTITLLSNFARHYAFNIDGYQAYTDRDGAGMITDRSIGFNVDIPLFAGGGVVARTNQATHFYMQQQQMTEESVRNTVNNTRQSFMNIMAGISQIRAGMQIIKSAANSLQGTIANFDAGYTTLIDVLNQEAKLYQAQLTYTTDRYEFVNNILLLKEAAGTLSFNDLHVINNWLISGRTSDHIKPFQEKLLHDIHQSNEQTDMLAQANRAQVLLTQMKDSNQLASLIDQIREETKLAYTKLEKEHQESAAEIARLKTSISDLKQTIQRKNDELKKVNINKLSNESDSLKSKFPANNS